jgi:hypothetical protein
LSALGKDLKDPRELKRRKQDTAAIGESSGTKQRGQTAVNLRQYLLWRRQHDMPLSEVDMKRFALQLAQAVHSLHADAHVRLS